MSNELLTEISDHLHLAQQRLLAVVPGLGGQAIRGGDRFAAQAIEQSARNIALAITGDSPSDADGVDTAIGEGDKIRADTALGLLDVIFGEGDIPPDFFSGSPLGERLAVVLGSQLATAWTYSTAAAHLGVKPATVGTLVSRGTLAKHPDGGLIIADVIRYGHQRRR